MFRGGPGEFQGSSRAVPGRVRGHGTKKIINTKKPEKRFRGCMARLLRSNIQDFVQEVPVGQMAQGTPFRCLLWPTPTFQ